MNINFSLKTIPITYELGMAIKNFRIEHDITAKSIITEFNKPSTYLTKLEKAEIKKIDGAFFCKLCNFISKTDSGVQDFLASASRRYSEYTQETKLILQNIDELLVEHKIPSGFIAEINQYMIEHNISIEQLTAKINANEDIIDNDEIDSIPTNEWVNVCSYDDTTSSIIKLDIPNTYLDLFLSDKLNYIHYVIAEAILYALYRLGNEDDARIFANNKLRINNIEHYLVPRYKLVNNDELDAFFSGLTPDTSEALHDITSSLKLAVNIAESYGLKRIRQINSNLNTDIGFSFAYMSQNLEKLALKSKEQKQQFLNELKTLIEKHSQTESGFDFYE